MKEFIQPTIGFSEDYIPAIPVMTPDRAQEIIDMATVSPSVQFCLPEGCVEPIKLGSEVVLFPPLPNQSIVEQSVPHSSGLAKRLQNPDIFSAFYRKDLHSVIVGIHYDHTLATTDKSISVAKAIETKRSIDELFNRITRLSIKNGSKTHEEREEYQQLLQQYETYADNALNLAEEYIISFPSSDEALPDIAAGDR
jgi:hypothetical protein